MTTEVNIWLLVILIDRASLGIAELKSGSAHFLLFSLSRSEIEDEGYLF